MTYVYSLIPRVDEDRYCWLIYFHVTQLLLLLSILHVPGHSTTAYTVHIFGTLG